MNDIKEKLNETFENVAEDCEFEKNKAIGGILGGQQRVDEGVLKAYDANENDMKEFKEGINLIDKKVKAAEDEYERAVEKLRLDI